MLKLFGFIIALLTIATLSFSDMIPVKIAPEYNGVYIEVAASIDGGDSFIKQDKQTSLEDGVVTTPLKLEWTIDSVYYDTISTTYIVYFKDKDFFWVVVEGLEQHFVIAFVDEQTGLETVRMLIEKKKVETPSSIS